MRDIENYISHNNVCACFVMRIMLIYFPHNKTGVHMNLIIGRKKEQKALEAAYKTDQPQFIALYGRRRVGKTYLVRNTLGHRDDCVFFYSSGIKDGTLSEQLAMFTDEIARAFGIARTILETKKNWRDVFGLLTEVINSSQQKKIVLFFDEFPWMVTPKSNLLKMLDHYWNRHWSMDNRIKLIICGSASNWIINNIVNNTGGLYSRTHYDIHLEPFNLHDTREYLKAKGVKLSDKEIVDLYMVLGGIPFYLDQVRPGLSAMQTIEQLAFRKGSFLLKEFSNLYDTLFGAESLHVELIELLADNCNGMAQTEIIKMLKNRAAGGWIVSQLKDLEQADFIQRFLPFEHEKRGVFYKIIDEYSLFFFKWIAPNKKFIERGEEKGFWMRLQSSPTWHAWAGCAFEAVCNKHVPLIRDALRLVMARASQWRFIPPKGSSEKGAQIDLLFDRDDNAITLCEIKYTKEPFVITKAYAETLQNKMDVFKKRTGTEKNLFLGLISANGLKENSYSEDLISGVVSLDDLFKEYHWY